MRYAFMIRPYVICIKNGIRKIEDVRPDELKQAVIEALASEGLGPDGKPLAKDEPKNDTTGGTKDEPKEPEKPIEEVKEDKPKEEKEPVKEDKGAK